MRPCALIVFAAAPLVALCVPATQAQQASPVPAYLERVNLGVDGLASDGLVERLAPHWKTIDGCRDLVVDRGTETQYWFAANEIVDGARRPVHLPCAMEGAGHRVVAVVDATATISTMPGETARTTFFLVRLRDGGEVIVDGHIVNSDRSAPGEAWFFTMNRRLFNARTGRHVELRASEVVRPGGVENPVTAMLLDRGGIDLALIGLGAPGAAPPPPGPREIEGAFLARVRQQYPEAGCSRGFRSTLAAFPGIEVCVNYNDVDVSPCDVRSRGRSAVCTMTFTVIVGSDTNPGLNPQFAELARPGRLVTGNFRYADATGWEWIATDDEVNNVVPADFRGRPYPPG